MRRATGRFTISGTDDTGAELSVSVTWTAERAETNEDAVFLMSCYIEHSEDYGVGMEPTCATQLAQGGAVWISVQTHNVELPDIQETNGHVFTFEQEHRDHQLSVDAERKEVHARALALALQLWTFDTSSLVVNHSTDGAPPWPRESFPCVSEPPRLTPAEQIQCQRCGCWLTRLPGGTLPNHTCATDEDLAGMAWWNGLDPVARRYWLTKAGTHASAADAYRAFLTE